MNPGPHGPEPSCWRVLRRPTSFARVRLNSNSAANVSPRDLLVPPGFGNVCPGCDPATTPHMLAHI